MLLTQGMCPCRPNPRLDGSPGTPPKKGTQPLADFVTYNDAITKMRFAKQNLESTGQPFFSATPAATCYVSALRFVLGTGCLRG